MTAVTRKAAPNKASMTVSKEVASSFSTNGDAAPPTVVSSCVIIERAAGGKYMIERIEMTTATKMMETNDASDLVPGLCRILRGRIFSMRYHDSMVRVKFCTRDFG